MQFYLKVGKILLKGFASILFRSEIKYRASHFLQAVFLILRNFKIFGFEVGHFCRAYICRAGGGYLMKLHRCKQGAQAAIIFERCVGCK